MKNYLQSTAVSAFPTAFRGAGINPTAAKTTEENLNLLNVLGFHKDSFVKLDGDDIIIVIKGYIFKVGTIASLESALNLSASDAQLWASIKLDSVSFGGEGGDRTTKLVTFDGTTNSDAYLDDTIEGEGTTLYFKGLYFSNESPETPYSIQVLFYNSEESKWEVFGESLLNIDTTQIGNFDGSEYVDISKVLNSDVVNSSVVGVSENLKAIGSSATSSSVDIGDMYHKFKSAYLTNSVLVGTGTTGANYTIYNDSEITAYARNSNYGSYTKLDFNTPTTSNTQYLLNLPQENGTLETKEHATNTFETKSNASTTYFASAEHPQGEEDKIDFKDVNGTVKSSITINNVYSSKHATYNVWNINKTLPRNADRIALMTNVNKSKMDNIMNFIRLTVAADIEAPGTEDEREYERVYQFTNLDCVICVPCIYKVSSTVYTYNALIRITLENVGSLYNPSYTLYAQRVIPLTGSDAVNDKLDITVSQIESIPTVIG